MPRVQHQIHFAELRMGMFDFFVAAVTDASESAHGSRLLKEFDDSVRRISQLDTRDEIINRFVRLRRSSKSEMQNWSRDGTLAKANDLRKKAKGIFDFDVVDGYSVWLVSTWMEASVRHSADAKHVWQQLDQLANQHDTLLAKEQINARVLKAQEKAREALIEREQKRLADEARLERRSAARFLEQAVKVQRGKSDSEDDFSGKRIAILKRAVRRVVEIGFKTTCAPDLRHVNWGKGDSTERVVACCVGFGISSAENSLSEPAVHIVFCANYLKSQGMGAAEEEYRTSRSITQYYVEPSSDLGGIVRTARDAMDAYLDGDRSALEELHSIFG